MKLESTLSLTEEQWIFIKKAIDAYESITNDVLTYDEIMDRRNNIILPIFTQMPDSIF